jgi:hypothetical protein
MEGLGDAACCSRRHGRTPLHRVQLCTSASPYASCGADTVSASSRGQDFFKPLDYENQEGMLHPDMTAEYYHSWVLNPHDTPV